MFSFLIGKWFKVILGILEDIVQIIVGYLFFIFNVVVKKIWRIDLFLFK